MVGGLTVGDFKRGLDEFKWDALKRLANEGDNWWTDLLSLWVPSGQPADDHDGPGLRFALRNGYLNFYRRGQSVARVCCGQRRNGRVDARMEIHAKYVWDNGAPDKYAQVNERDVMCGGLEPVEYAGLSTLKGWIARSEDWAGKEKCGVDMVVGANPTVIDLEMGIPAWGARKSALRVDIVALDGTDAEPQLVLWEAKPLHAGALRARNGNAQIIAQMADYQEYLASPVHRRHLSEAYRSTCCALVKLAEMAGSRPMLVVVLKL